MTEYLLIYGRRSGVNIAAIVDAAIAGQRTTYADIREKTLRYMVSAGFI